MNSKELSDLVRREMGFKVERIIDAAEYAHYVMYDPHGEIVIVPNTSVIVSGDTEAEAWGCAPELSMEDVMNYIKSIEKHEENETEFYFEIRGSDETECQIYIWNKDENLTKKSYGKSGEYKCALFNAALEYFRDRKEQSIVRNRYETMKDEPVTVTTSADDVLAMFGDDDDSVLG